MKTKIIMNKIMQRKKLKILELIINFAAKNTLRFYIWEIGCSLVNKRGMW